MSIHRQIVVSGYTTHQFGHNDFHQSTERDANIAVFSIETTGASSSANVAKYNFTVSKVTVPSPASKVNVNSLLQCIGNSEI